MEKQKKSWVRRIFSRNNKTTNTNACGCTVFKNLGCELQTKISLLISNDIMQTPEVRNIIDTLATMFSTIPVFHIRTNQDGKTEYIESDITRVINIEPNILQTKTTFLTTAMTQFLVYNNVAIVPKWGGEDDDILQSLEPLPYTDWLTIERNGKYYVEFQQALPPARKQYAVKDIILLQRYPTLEGGRDNKPLNLLLQIANGIQQWILNTVEKPDTVGAYLQYTMGTTSKEAKIAKAKEVNEVLQEANNENPLGLMVLDSDVKLNAIDIKQKPIPVELLKIGLETIYNSFGGTEELVQRKLSSTVLETIVKLTIKPIANQWGEEFTRKLFTQGEKDHKNQIKFETFSLTIKSIDDIIKLRRNALLGRNEIREDIMGIGTANDLEDEFVDDLNVVPYLMKEKYQMARAKSGQMDKRVGDMIQQGGEEDGN